MSIKYYLSKDHPSFSLIPIIGGFLILLGCFFYAESKFHWYFIFFIFLDIGCGPLILGIVFDNLRKSLARKSD